MSTHNICFYGELEKIIPELSTDTPTKQVLYPNIVWMNWRWFKTDYAHNYVVLTEHAQLSNTYTGFARLDHSIICKKWSPIWSRVFLVPQKCETGPIFDSERHWYPVKFAIFSVKLKKLPLNYPECPLKDWSIETYVPLNKYLRVNPDMIQY